MIQIKFGRTDHKCVGPMYMYMLSFFTRVQRIAKEKIKIIMRKRKQQLKRALAIDILVKTCHVKIPSKTLFS